MKDQKISPILIKPMQGGGLTEEKKAGLDTLVIQVQDAQYVVDQNQAIVTALTEKLHNFQNFLAIADTRRTEALHTKNLVDQLVQSAKGLQGNSQLAYNEIVAADEETKALAIRITDVLNKLIYSAEVIHRLASLVIRKKALNPLIADELISVLTIAGTDADNAVALTLAALQSTFAAQATTIAAEQAMALEYSRAMELHHALTGIKPGPPIKIPPVAPITIKKGRIPLSMLLHRAYRETENNYELACRALNITTTQLNNAQPELNKSQVSLRSLQAGLAAANAAYDFGPAE